MDILSFTEQFSAPRFLLHSGKEGSFSILGIGKKHEIEIFGKEKDILTELDTFWKNYGQECLLPENHLPFQGGIFVFLSYDLVENFENISLKNTHPYIPKIYAVVPEELYIFDHLKKKVFSSKADFSYTGLSLQGNMTKQSKTSKIHSSDSLSDFNKYWKTTISEEKYKKHVEKIKKEITQGNSFQVNFSQRFTTQQKSPSFDIFKKLCAINPSPFSAYFETPFGEIISGSPERLVQLKNGIIETKPIAGTRKRGVGKEDKNMESELHKNTKEQAEHNMIVDLERNDMGKVCEYGTVEVKKHGNIEKYSHVQHLVSTITGKLQEGKNFCDVIQAMHPGGTITGCPKHETCKIIADHELFDRGIYTGALGYINHKGDMDLNILIRSIFAHEGTLETQAGGGIVYDSIPEKEYKETLHKASAQFIAGS